MKMNKILVITALSFLSTLSMANVMKCDGKMSDGKDISITALRNNEIKKDRYILTISGERKIVQVEDEPYLDMIGTNHDLRVLAMNIGSIFGRGSRFLYDLRFAHVAEVHALNGQNNGYLVDKRGMVMAKLQCAGAYYLWGHYVL